MTTAENGEDALMRKMRELTDHFAAGGTLKSAANLTDAELEAIYAVAYNQFSAQKYDKAIELFKFLCLYDHTEPRWWYGLGVVRQQARQYEEAVNAFGMATLFDVDDPRPQAQAGYCLVALGRRPEAVSALEGALIACGKAPEHAAVRQQAEGLLAAAREKGGSGEAGG